MNTKMPANFRIIGSCVPMQTVSWDEEIKLIDGFLYNINFDIDFSKVPFLDGRLISEASIASVIEEIKRLETEEDERNRLMSWIFSPAQSERVSKKERTVAKKAVNKHKKALRNLGL